MLGAVRYNPIHEKEGRIDLLDKPLKLDDQKSNYAINFL